MLLTGLSFNTYAQKNANVAISPDSKLTISRFIYGQFAEHLGHGVYGGFWVDKTLPVPKQDRIRLDVVNALKRIKISVSQVFSLSTALTHLSGTSFLFALR